MMRLYVVVEGQTEEAFVRRVLAPHLQGLSVWAVPIVVTTSRDRRTGLKHRGGGRWAHWRNDLARLMSQHRGPEVRFTTLLDLYGFPVDFPNYSALAAVRETVERADKLEAAMWADVGDHRFIPYVQRHEVEALVLVDLEPLGRLAGPSAPGRGVDALRRDIDGLAPEAINDGPETAPSKRLLRFIPGYRKTLHGPLVMEALQLSVLRAACPRFDWWVGCLERLGSEGGGSAVSGAEELPFPR